MAPAAKLQSYCSMIYAYMDANAVEQEGERVWQGRIMGIVEALDIPQGSYSKALNLLRKIGSVEQVSRGYRGSAFSIYVLRAPPTFEEPEILQTKVLTGGPSLDRLASQVNDLATQIGGINIPHTLLNFEQRLAR